MYAAYTRRVVSVARLSQHAGGWSRASCALQDHVLRLVLAVLRDAPGAVTPWRQ